MNINLDWGLHSVELLLKSTVSDVMLLLCVSSERLESPAALMYMKEPKLTVTFNGTGDMYRQVF